MRYINPTKTKSWNKLNEHFKDARFFKMKNLFAEDKFRAKKLTIEWEDFYVDFSKNIVTAETMDLLTGLAEEVELKEAIEAYFKGDKINKTENRAVLHTALRIPNNEKMVFEGNDLVPEISKVKNQMASFSDSVISGSKRGFTGKAFTDVVNIGIGGSDLGPVMVTESLQHYKNHLNLHFISNVDGDHSAEILKLLNPETTLFVIVSKSFGTQETITNATSARNWFLAKAPEKAIAQHFVAVSSNVSKVEDFGIDAENVFPMWNWVGGRFSLWSSVGLSICLSVGFSNFQLMLEGAHAMDQHFRQSELNHNIPVQLALLSVWYNNFFKAESEAVIPYNQYLHRFPAYLQQAIMESNGKNVDRNGEKVSYQTGNIIWGEPGTNAQHAFFQLIHQGTKLIPTEFIGFVNPLHENSGHHNKLMANFFAQTKALLYGKSAEEVEAELKDASLSSEEIKNLLPYKIFEGNKPTTSILINKLTPASLGKLVALYEHKIFVQGIIWNIFSYDQWGVELGKQLASNILDDLNEGESSNECSSTSGLVERFMKAAD